MMYVSIGLAALLIIAIYNINEQKKHNKTLSKSIRKLSEKNKETSDKRANFLATASHDLQQPHQALGLFLASINQEALDVENMRIINKAKDAHETTSRLLNQLFDISKLDSALKPELKPTALHDLVHQVGMKFMPVAACYGVELRIRPRDAYVRTDPIMLERMLTNILLNAFRHAKRANVLLSIRKKDLHQLPAKWVIEVYDTGMGIPEDKQELIFQEFTQLNKPEYSPSGLGLGLAIVKRLSAILNHPVGLRSRLGKGSCFHIQLEAIQQSKKHKIPNIVTSDSVIRERMKVAVINENMMLRDSIETLLSSWGCQVKAFPSSSKALHTIKELAWKPDALIIDGTLRSTQLNLGHIQDIRNLSGQDMPMVLISDETNSTFAKEAQRFGFALLADPIESKTLRELLGNR